MSLRSDLYLYLINATPLYGLVGQRIFPNDVPKGTTFPAISSLLVSGVPEQPLGGSLIYGTLARLQWDVLASDSDTRDSVRDTLITALCGFTGGPSVTVFDKGIVGLFDTYDPQTFVSRASVDWMVLYA